jgi:hypothetical protein
MSTPPRRLLLSARPLKSNRPLTFFLPSSLPIFTLYEPSRWNGQTRVFQVSYDSIGCCAADPFPSPFLPFSPE